MRYANVLFYVADPDAVAAARPVHRAYMADLKRQGKLAAGGPYTHARLIPQRIGCLCVGQMIRK